MSLVVTDTGPYSGPEWVLNGRTYRTVSGLSRAIFKDCGCDSHSMVRNGRITCTVGRGAERRVVAVYTVSDPERGQAMTVARMGII